MRLQSLSLQGFRSYQKATVPFADADQFLFFGDNGSGKTNIVEAISYLSAGRSCLRLLPDTAVRWGETFFRLTATLQKDSGDALQVEHVFQTSPRRGSAFFVNDLRTPLLSFIGTVPTILFLPEYLDLFTGAPQGRRQFLDSLIVQLLPTFASERLEYDRVLKQRNALLKAIASGQAQKSDLAVWNQALTNTAMPILKARRTILSTLGNALPTWIQHFGEPWNVVELLYLSKTDATHDAFLRALEAAVDKDILRESTTVGPHRDDWTTMVDGHALADFASRGQQRTTLLALLSASAKLFEEYRQEKPIVILDDVFSELDQSHQEALIQSLQDTQVIMTCTHSFPKKSGFAQRRVAAGMVEA